MRRPTPPRHLSKETRAVWRRLNGEYELGDDAQLILRAALESWDRAQEARRLVSRQGLMTPEGRRHPGCDVEKQAYSLFLRAMRQLGLDIVEPGPPGRPPGGG